MVENRDDGILTGPWFGSAQPAAENLGDQKLTIESAFFVGNDLKDILHVPPFAEHGYGNDELDLA